MMPDPDKNLETDGPSCVSGMTRKEFVSKLLVRAAIGSAILALATEINRHSLPALSSTTTAT